jgi:(p)ppGpp synthase/HD superfamily hydrolase
MKVRSQSEQVNKAAEYVITKFNGEKRRGGEETLSHFFRVKSRLEETFGHNEEMAIVALLHDVLEDTSTTHQDIVNLFGESVADDVLTLSNIAERPYMDFIDAIVNSERILPIRVKYFDIIDNISGRPSLRKLQLYGLALGKLAPHIY